VYTYYIETLGSDGQLYYSEERLVNVGVPADENISGIILPAGAFFGLLITFTDETTPKSHSRVGLDDGIYVSGLAINVNGSVENVTLFILDEDGTNILSTTELDTLDEDGTNILSTTELDTTNNGNNSWSLFGFSSLPRDATRISIQLGVTDSGGRSAYSVSRKLIIIPENAEGIIKDSIFPFINPFGDESDSDGPALGRIFAATLIMLVLIGGLYASGAGTLPSVAFGIMVSIEFVTFGFIPVWVSILGVVLLAMIMMRSVLAMWLRR
jgi:hypothetical protein